jgi:Domain of unknown function (DUF4407)
MQNSMVYFRRFRQFVLALSGAHAETLQLVPSERPRFESLGWAILITSSLAVVSMWFALASAMNVNGILAIPLALLWGLVIMGIDRWLVTSMPIDNNRKFALAAPRVVLALLLGTLISTPLVLRVFQSEINVEIASMQQSNYNTFLQQQDGSAAAQQVSTLSKEITNLNTIINSHGASTGDNSNDPEIVAYNTQLSALQKQLTTETTAENQDLKEYSCQKYGGANCPKAGVGPAAKASLDAYNQAKAQVQNVQGEINQVQQKITARTNELSSTSAVDEQNRYQEALAQRPSVQAQYNVALQREDQQQAVFYAQNQASHGILTRLEALSKLSDSNLTVTVARFLLFLLFLVIELLPVTVKLLQKPGHYEAALAKAKVAESRDVEEYYSEWAGLRENRATPAFVSPAAEQASPAAAPAFETRQERLRRRHTEEERAAADAMAVWNPTRVMPPVVGDPADDVRTEVLNQQTRAEGPVQFPPVESSFKYPPSEKDPRATAREAAQAPNDWVARDDDRQRGPGWDQQMADISALWANSAPPASEAETETRAEYGFPAGGAGETRKDPYQPEPTPRGEESRSQPSRSLHDELSDMDDEAPYSAHTENGTGGMPLNWDDE